jgi:hypothetical protein
MNARTSDYPDFVQDDHFLHMHVLPDDYVAYLEIKRFPKDKGHLNDNGLFLLNLCKQTGLRILNDSFGATR